MLRNFVILFRAEQGGDHEVKEPVASRWRGASGAVHQTKSYIASVGELLATLA